MLKRSTFGLWFVAAALLFSVFVFDRLPGRVATHFNARGQPDGWSGRFLAAALMPVVAAGLVGLFNGLPRLLPRREQIEQFADYYWLLANAVVGFVCALHVVVLGRAIGWPIDMPAAILLGIGALFVVIGNIAPRTRSNWIMGIRTPWTLESEHVWRETHWLAGRTFITGGLITMAAAFLPAALQPWVAMSALIIGAFIPVIYSYFVWRKEREES